MAEIKLLPIEESDLQDLLWWRNSSDVMPYCRQYRQLSVKNMQEWYKKLHEDKDYNLTNDLFIIEHDNNKIGVGGFVRIDWRNRKGELSFYVGESSFRTQEIINKALMAIVGYGFKTLNLWKIYFPIYSFNPYLSMYKEVLKEEYIAKEEYYWQGKYYDRIILTAYNK